MADGLPDRVDYLSLAEDAAVLQRVYELGAMPRVQGLLAAASGSLRATFAFAKTSSGRPGADVTVEADPQLVCQRCLQGFDRPVAGRSSVEFVAAEPEAAAEDREYFVAQHGQVSLRELAEEEFLLALPIAPACDTPLTCGKAPSYAAGGETPEVAAEMRRPFSDLRDLLRKT